MDRKRLGIGLRLAREAKGLTQPEAAQRAGMGERSLIDYEAGKTSPPIDKLVALLTVYGFRSVGEFENVYLLGNGSRRVVVPRADGEGAARPDWSVRIAREAIDDAVLAGFAAGALEPGDERALADFVASVEAAAREVALSITRELVAEPAKR